MLIHLIEQFSLCNRFLCVGYECHLYFNFTIDSLYVKSTLLIEHVKHTVKQSTT